MDGISIVERPLAWPGKKKERERERESAGRLKAREDLSSNGSKDRYSRSATNHFDEVTKISPFPSSLPPCFSLFLSPPPSCSPFKFTEQRGFALMNIQRNEWTVFSIYQRHSPSISFADRSCNERLEDRDGNQKRHGEWRERERKKNNGRMRYRVLPTRGEKIFIGKKDCI